MAKWRKRATVEDMKTGPTEPRSTVLTEADEAMVVAFRRHTLLPLDDWVEAEAPRPVDLPIEGAASLNAAVIPVVLHGSVIGMET